MEFTHYDYKCIFYEPSENPDKKYKEIRVTASNRSEISLNHDYHTSWIGIHSGDKSLERFSLGVDFSPPGSIMTDRCVDRLFLNFIIRGKGRINGKPFSAGHFYYTVPLQPHSFETDRDDPFVSVWMSVEGTYAYDIINRLNQISSDSMMKFDHRWDVMNLTKTFLYETSLGDMSTSYLRSLIDIYIAHVKKNEQSDSPESYATPKIAKLIRDSKSYVRKNLRHVTVAEMAAKQHYNINYFSRIFTQAMGMTPLEYITDCKMEWAKNSLAHSNLSIEEIMEAIGYNHRNGFTIAFKKKYGCPPAEYRKRSKK